jgi:hypothetical protein
VYPSHVGVIEQQVKATELLTVRDVAAGSSRLPEQRHPVAGELW